MLLKLICCNMAFTCLLISRTRRTYRLDVLMYTHRSGSSNLRCRQGASDRCGGTWMRRLCLWGSQYLARRRGGCGCCVWIGEGSGRITGEDSLYLLICRLYHLRMCCQKSCPLFFVIQESRSSILHKRPFYRSRLCLLFSPFPSYGRNFHFSKSFASQRRYSVSV